MSGADFDPTVLRELADAADAGTARDVVQILAEDAAPSLQAIADAVSSGDAARLREHAHRLKGSCSAVGLPAATALCAALEAIARTGGTAGADAQFALLGPALERGLVLARAAVS